MTMHLKSLGLSLSAVKLLAPFNLEIEDGEIVTLMGPSGCGKSSLLAYIAGDLEPPLAGFGAVELNGRDLSRMRPELRRVGRLFQDDLLFPHLTVGENILFGMRRGPHAERIGMMKRALQRAELEGFENRSPLSLSGGQRTRVSLVRALMAKPDCMLLDEPFNKLDQELRAAMRTYIFGHIAARGIPCLLVTHDIEDAPLGGRVFRIGRDGELMHV
jgi:putative thiamine transport system ATP-binding protein